MAPRSAARPGGHWAVPASAPLAVALVARCLLAMAAGLLFWSVAPSAVGWSSQVVLSGSMMPHIASGDVVVTQPVPAGSLKIGQVILVSNPARPGTLLMHRLVGRRPDGMLVTRGDANATADSAPVSPSAVRGLPRIRLPYNGLPLVWTQQGRYGPVVAAAFLLIIVGSVTGAGTRRHRCARSRPRKHRA